MSQIQSCLRKVSHFLKKRKLVFKLFLLSLGLFFCASLFYFHNSQPQGDEPHYLIISQSLLTYHSLYVIQDYEHQDYLAFYPGPIDPQIEKVGNKYLPVRRVGGPVLWLPFFALWGRLGVLYFMSFITAFIICNIYLLLTEQNIKRHIAYLVCIAMMMGSPLYIYSHLTFIEPIGALCIIYCFRKVSKKGLILKRELIISSLLLGVLPFVHIRFTLIAFPILVLLFLRIHFKQKKKIVSYLSLFLPIILCFIILEIFTFHYWHTLNPAAPELFNKEKTFLHLIPRGLLGVLFDQEYGLLFPYPMFVFAIVGFFICLKGKSFSYVGKLLCIALIYLLVFTSFPDWKGGWAPPARYSLVLLPLVAYFIAVTLQTMENFLAWGLFRIFFIMGFIYNLFTFYAPASGFNVENGVSVTFAYIQIHTGLLITDYLPSVFKTNQTGLFLFWIFILFLVCLFVYFSNYLTSFLSGDTVAKEEL